MMLADSPSAAAGPDWSHVSRDPYPLLIDGELSVPAGRETLDVVYPFTNEVVAHVYTAYVNGYYSPSMHETPMAGQKQSGVGEAGLTKYMQSKAVFITLDAAH